MRNKPTERAFKAAVNMEVHAACSTRTDEKAAALDEHFPAYDDLLTALTELNGAIVDCQCNGGTPGFDGGRLDRAQTAALAAIAKAAGKSDA